VLSNPVRLLQGPKKEVELKPVAKEEAIFLIHPGALGPPEGDGVAAGAGKRHGAQARGWLSA